MGVKIESAAALRELAQSFGIEIDDPDDLHDLLLIANCSESTPDLAAKVLEAREKRKEQERQLSHQVRLREMELRYRMQTRVEGKGKRPPAWLGFLATVGLAGVALGATAIIQGSGVSEWVFAVILGIVWGTTALIAVALLLLAYAGPHADKFLQLAKRSDNSGYMTDDVSATDECETAFVVTSDETWSMLR